GFPFTDRLASPLAHLDANTTLTLTILGDGTVSGLAIPEPPTLLLLALGGLTLFALRGRHTIGWLRPALTAHEPHDGA
ncbi:MAG: PEP-CTERM sorting domain-containing protein, partial [Roseiarcus sp.]